MGFIEVKGKSPAWVKHTDVMVYMCVTMYLFYELFCYFVSFGALNLTVFSNKYPDK